MTISVLSLRSIQTYGWSAFFADLRSSSRFRSNPSALAISEAKKAGSFTPPGIEKLVPSRPNRVLGAIHLPGAEIKIPAERMVKRRGKKVDWEEKERGARE